MRTLLAGVLMLFLALPAAADDSEAVATLLDKMASANQYLNYKGTFTFVNGNTSWTMKVVHSFDRHGEREYLATAAGAPRTVYRDDHTLVTIVPERSALLVVNDGEKQKATGALERRFGINEAFYEYYLDGTEEVAGYTCQVVSIVPRDSHRFGYRLCIENDSGLLLKSLVVDKAGQPKEQLVFSEMALQEDPPQIKFQADKFKWPEDRQAKPAPLSVESVSLLPRWRLGWAPPGFRVASDQTRILPDSRTPVRHIVLDDGIATISIFVKRPADGERFLASTESSGALNTLLSVKNGFVITIMGEVPKTTISAIYAAMEAQS